MTIQTHPYYWDCECPTNYIHPKMICNSYCLKCGANAEDQPDSRINEVEIDLEVKRQFLQRIKCSPTRRKYDCIH